MKKFLLLLFFAMGGATLMAQSNIEILTQDIDNFWQAYDELPKCNSRADSIQAFQKYYIDQGTEGLVAFIKVRDFTAPEYYKVVKAYPKFWESIRPNTQKILSMKSEIVQIYKDYEKAYPGHNPPKICFAIGTLRTGGTTSKEFMLIGSEIVAADRNTDKSELGKWLNSVMTDEMEVPGFVAHEYIHTQQKITFGTLWAGLNHRLLLMSLMEGGADFLAETITGWKINEVLHTYGNAHESEVRQAFEQDVMKNDFSQWLYQGNNTKGDQPADLGYYMGYKICEAYYKKTEDKDKALKELLVIRNYKKVLKKSGYLD